MGTPKRPYRVAVVAALVAVGALFRGADAVPPTTYQPVTGLRPLAVPPRMDPGTTAVEPRTDPAPVPTPGLILEPIFPGAMPLQSSPHQPRVAQPHSRSETIRAPSRLSQGGTKRYGTATWYCRAGVSVCHRDYPDRAGPDLYAAAGSELRVGHWRGRSVTVCERGTRNCVRVKLVDWCACGGNRIIDLYWDAARAIGDYGVMRVTVSW